MQPFDESVQEELAAIRAANLYRELRPVHSRQGPTIEISGGSRINFSSNDYLGLAAHPSLVEAAARASRDFGAGTGASRLVSGSLEIHHQLEEALAAYKQTERALVFSTGYAAAVGTIPALVQKPDVVVIDRLVHASIVDGARLSGATIRVFRHNDLSSLEGILKWARSRSMRRVLIATESVFSMDGDRAPLRELVELKDRFGAWLMVDEAHSTGLHGVDGRGMVTQEGLNGRVEIQMGTLGKALGAAGGFICGTRGLIDLLINRARSFIFSTAPAPAVIGAARAALAIVSGTEGNSLRADFWRNANAASGLLLQNRADSGILPIMIGDENRAMAVAQWLGTSGFHVPAIRYPTVQRGRARLRVTVTAGHSGDQIRALHTTIADALATPM